MKAPFLLVALLVLGSSSMAEEATAHAGQNSREIKALSAAEIQGYLEGRGMGFAKTAELNGYPGPDHVLELANQLELTPQQRSKAEHLKRSMKKAAARLGYWRVETEHRLDVLFAKGEADDEKITPLVQRIGSLDAEIRLVHLRAHIEMRRALTAEQIKKYQQLRGNANPQ
jgi:Spy/CpxP family protein refolding chaperone